MTRYMRTLVMVIGGSAALALIGGIALGYAERGIAVCDGSNACMMREVKDAFAQRGLDASLRKIEHAYALDRDFRARCFSFTLAATEALYRKDMQIDPAELTARAATCNYGFLQEYPRAMLIAGSDLAAVRTFCLRAGGLLRQILPGAQAECFRGVGRGLPFVAHTNDLAARAVFGVAQCRVLASRTDDQDTCISGVFNILAREDDGAIVRSRDPLALCKAQADQDSRARCFGNFKAVLLPILPSASLASSTAALRTFYGNDLASYGVAVQLLGYDAARDALASSTPRTVAQSCVALGGQDALNCIAGASVGYAKNGPRGAQYLTIIDFCSVARSYYRGAAIPCPGVQALGYLRGQYAPALFAIAYQVLRQRLGDMPRLPYDVFGY